MAEKPLSIKQLLNRHKLTLSPATANSALLSAGVLRYEKYESTTESGEIKSYLKVAEKYQDLGENKKSGFHEFKTSPVFYPGKSKTLLDIIIKTLSLEVGRAISEIEQDASK